MTNIQSTCGITPDGRTELRGEHPVSVPHSSLKPTRNISNPRLKNEDHNIEAESLENPDTYWQTTRCPNQPRYEVKVHSLEP
jgi:hypothetical protein